MLGFVSPEKKALSINKWSWNKVLFFLKPGGTQIFTSQGNLMAAHKFS